MRGWRFIRERLQLDVAALNKVELLCWDLWSGLSEEQPEDKNIYGENNMSKAFFDVVMSLDGYKDITHVTYKELIT